VTAEEAVGAAAAKHAARLAARAEEVALCLDFDGTLSPIVPDPDAARPLKGVVELLGRLAARYTAVALVSGRPPGRGGRLPGPARASGRPRQRRLP
jgi:trehalose 6-phosphate phosphatase